MDETNILGLVYSNICTKKFIVPVTVVNVFLCTENLNELNIKYQSYEKSAKMGAFEHKNAFMSQLQLRMSLIERWGERLNKNFKKMGILK